MTAFIYFLPLPGVVFVEFLPRRNRLITSFSGRMDYRTPMRRVRQG
nr:MAG TPA_asm: hypothetical protein [Caudoviricetes sp.]